LENTYDDYDDDDDDVNCTRHIVGNVQRHLTDKGVQSATRQKIVALLKRCLGVSRDRRRRQRAARDRAPVSTARSTSTI